MSDEFQEIVQEFLVESFESLDSLDQDFVELEENPQDIDTINKIFRAAHTIKGTCGFLGFSKLESFTHVAETLLDSLRSGRVSYDSDIATALLKSVDAIRHTLTCIEETGNESSEDFSELINTLVALNKGEKPEASEEPTPVEEQASASVENVEEETAAEEVLSSDTEENAEVVEQEVALTPSDDKFDQMLEELDKNLDQHRSASEEESSVTEVAPEESLSVSDAEASEPAGDTEFDPDVANMDLLAELMSDEPLPEEKAKLEEEQKAAEPAKPVEPAPVQKEETPVTEKVAQPEKQEEPVAVVEDVVEETQSLSVADKEEQAPLTSKAPVPSSSPSFEREGGAGGGSKLADTSLRVNVTLLDSLMNLVGELVLARNQILQFTKSSTDTALVNTCQRLNLITSELQEGVMKTRMQPIANVWNKFPRIIRDIARGCGKDIKIEMEGKDTDLDKTILEAIKDPLTHIVRNSADHGIESPEVREQAGKPRAGTLHLSAYHEGGHVIIEIRDDGAGIDAERVRDKAIEKGVITAEQAKKMGESDLQKLIFAPGFSTAEKVTNVSGRGVGMDVVRSNIERIGGTVDLQSQKGSGTTLFIKIPLTLAIVPALIVTCNDDRFAIPQVSLLELLRVEKDDVATNVETIGNSKFYRLRGNLLPLVQLSEQLKLESTEKELTGDINIVVVRAENTDFGLIVDRVHDTEEIVVKPLGRQLKELETFSGATIMGDGRVALILDVLGIARGANVAADVSQELERMSEAAALEIEGSEKQSLLLVQVGSDYRFAIPLNDVNRLEEFEAAQIERASGRDVVQYRGGILPLINLQEFFNLEPRVENAVKHVVVFSNEHRSIGVVVEQILDIVEERLTVDYSKGCSGIQGSAIIQKSITDLLDVQEILKKREPNFLQEEEMSSMEIV